MKAFTPRGALALAAVSVTCGLVPAGSTAATDSSTTSISICTTFSPKVTTCPRFIAKPSRIRFGSTGRILLEHLHWINWGTPNATAWGTLRLRTGTRYTYRFVLAGASNIGPCDGLQIYERLAVFTGGPLQVT
jgi:hypothetical protein